MKLRLKQPGFETYTGQMGVIFFENGLSTDHVSTLNATRMSAVMLCEWEDGATSNVAQSILDHADTPAPVMVSGEDGQYDTDAAAAKSAAPAGPVWTADELAEVADKSGIKGLREIGDPAGVKGNAIRDLIDAIAKANVAKG